MRKPTTGEEQVPLRTFLLNGVLRFTITVGGLPGVSRIALMGSLGTLKVSPKDADVLVTVAADSSLDRLAKASRALKGYAQSRNSGADSWPTPKGSTSDAFAIGASVALESDSPARPGAVAREFLNEDLQVVNLPSTLVAAPPIEISPIVVRRVAIPADVERILLQPPEARR